MKDPNKILKGVVSGSGLLKTMNKAADNRRQPYSFVCESRLQTQFLKRNPISEIVARSCELLDCEFVSNPHLTDSLELNFKSVLKALTRPLLAYFPRIPFRGLAALIGHMGKIQSNYYDTSTDDES